MKFNFEAAGEDDEADEDDELYMYTEDDGEDDEEQGARMRALLEHMQNGGNLEDFMANVQAERAKQALAEAPARLQPRLAALMANNAQRDEVDAEKRAALEALEVAFRAKCAPVDAARKGIIDGSTALEGEAELLSASEEQVAVEEADESNPSRAGVPNFWGEAIANHPLLGSQLGERDRAALSYITDVSCEEKEAGSGFVIKMSFAPNPFFANTLLTKDYDLARTSADSQPALRDLTGTKIEWKDAAHNLVEVEVKKKQKQKARKGKPAQTRVVVVKKKTPSFFQFFDPPTLPDEDTQITHEEMEELQQTVDEDFEGALALRGKVIPDAVMYFLGLAQDSEYGGEEGSDEEIDFDEETGTVRGMPAGVHSGRHWRALLGARPAVPWR